MSWTFEKPSSDEIRVILVRHGESTFNAQGRHQGSSDESVLTELGKSMARQTGKFLSGLTVDALYVSSLRRAQETASEMLSMMTPAVNLQNVHVVWQLREIDLPAWQGLCHKDVRTKFAEEYRCWKQSPHQFSMEDPHTKQRFLSRARTLRAIATILAGNIASSPRANLIISQSFGHQSGFDKYCVESYTCLLSCFQTIQLWN
ncbi:MAG: histidine phosphatase family protein [Acaryochloridaceae cyanobacterium RU_4_10]|nr:histidine phosphatase family protein [Acaryochloridaceae cyanobacterium RU_4_10]